MTRIWPARLLALVLAVIGLTLTIGGGWLIALGGSAYYLVAGLAMLGSAWLFWQGRLLGGWVYVALFLFSAAWGFAEARGDAWALVPWLIAPLVLLIFTAIVMASMSADANRWKWAGGGIALALVFVIGSFALMGSEGTAVAALPPPSSQVMNDPSGLATGADWPAYGGTYAAWRYSPLNQIDAGNVGKLEKVWETHIGGMPSDPKYQKLYGT